MAFRVLIADSLASEGPLAVASRDEIQVDNRQGIEREELLAIIADYQALVVRSRTQVDEAVLTAGVNLQIVGRAGIGVDNVDVTAATKRGVIVMNTPDGNAVTTAEHTLSMILSASRHIAQATASMKAGRWEKKKFMGRELTGKTLGIVGLGNIGRIVADRAQGLKMRVVGYDPFFTAEAALRIGVEYKPLAEVLSESDVISVHTPLNEHTKHMVSDSQIETMKPGVLLVNCARGGIYDEAALVRGLESGKIGAIALDVFVAEPPPHDHPLLSHERVIATPHLGASTTEAQVNVAVAVLTQIADFAAGEPARNGLNLPRLSPKEFREVAPYFELANKLGRFCGQLADGPISRVEVALHGELAEKNASPIATAALAGAMGCMLSAPVNAVNARMLAQDRGIDVVELRCGASERGYASCIDVHVHATTTHVVTGTLFAEGEGRIVEIDGTRLEALPEGHMLLISNKDTPGAIGQIGTALGEAGVNISRMQLGLLTDGAHALTVVNVDQAVTQEVLASLTRVEQVVAVHCVAL